MLQAAFAGPGMELHSWPNRSRCGPRGSASKPCPRCCRTPPNPLLLRDEAVPTQTVFLSNAKMLDGVLKPSSEVGLGSIATEMGSPRDVRLSPNSGGIADIPALRVCARLGHVRLLLSAEIWGGL